jgi:hypothetical protein
MSVSIAEVGGFTNQQNESAEPDLLKLLGRVLYLEFKTAPARLGVLLAKLQDRPGFLGAVLGGDGQGADLRRSLHASRLEGYNELDIAA